MRRNLINLVSTLLMAAMVVVGVLFYGKGSSESCLTTYVWPGDAIVAQVFIAELEINPAAVSYQFVFVEKEIILVVTDSQGNQAATEVCLTDNPQIPSITLIPLE